MPPAAYLGLVAATNFKQRVRKMTEYYHADRLGYAVAGTPNRLEYDQGFFVKQGDGAADFKPIAHLYKTQVYALAAYLGVPEEIRQRPPTTDTYSLEQTQDEFYFALPYDRMDLCLYAHNHGVPPDEVAPVVDLEPGAGRARVPRHRVEAAHDPLPAHAAALIRTRRRGRELAMCGIAGVLSLRRSLAAARLRQARNDGRGAAPPRARRVRRLPRLARRPGPRAAVDHRSFHRPAADGQRGRDPLGRLQRRDLQLHRAARRAHRARPRVPHPERHRGHRARLRAVGRRRVRALQRPVGARALGHPRQEAGAVAGQARHPPAVLLRARRPLLLRQRGQGHLRGGPRRSRVRSTPSGSTRPSRSGRSCRRRACSRTSSSSSPATSGPGTTAA